MKKYTLEISGYGAEVTIGSLDDSQVALIKKHDGDLSEFVIENFDWRDMDEFYHNFGACSAFLIIVKSEDGSIIYEIDSEDLNAYDNEENEFELIERRCFETKNDKPMLMCISFLKGLIFQTEIITDKFDIQKLKIVMDDEIGFSTYYWGEMINTLYYNGQELYETGTNTDEKSFEAHVNFELN
ncbi:MAG: hypothetical protein RLZ10_2554 [Bacteroidota bacterium]|jgi:hypothetical protein